MDPEDFKQAWKTQSSQSRLTIDAELLLNELRRNQQSFAAIIFWRDLREVGVSLLLAPVWIYLGMRNSLPWTWYLAIPAFLWIAGFMLIDRLRHKPQPPGPGEPLRQHVESLLAQVGHQIWLLRNVFWWYLLPLALPMLAFFVQSALQDRSGGWVAALGFSIAVAVSGIAFAGVYWLNQLAVRATLEPRRRELETLLKSLEEEPPEVS